MKDNIYLLRGHQIEGLQTGRYGYDPLQAAKANEIRRANPKQIKIVSGPGSLCAVCPLNASAPNFDDTLPSCDPFSPVLEELDLRVINVSEDEPA